jgi:RNA polymerase primary sigma factor
MTAMTETKAKKMVKAGNAQTFKTSSDENILLMYLKEIGRIPLLTREEETETARAAAAGSKAAREKLVNANLRFVVNVAKKYQGQGLSLADLISEGNIGLIQAIDRYDVDRGYHFISYAVWWIRQAILRALGEKSRMIRLPQNRNDELIQIRKTRKLVHEYHSEESEIREIAEMLSLDKGHVEDLLNIAKDTISLETPIGTGRDATLGDHIEAEHYTTPEQYTMQHMLTTEIENLLNTLDEKEAEVLRCRFGLGRRQPMTLEEIGDRYNLTKERVRQIEKRAIVRLQNPTRSERLRSYVA